VGVKDLMGFSVIGAMVALAAGPVRRGAVAEAAASR
jgi:hypothetical protein